MPSHNRKPGIPHSDLPGVQWTKKGSKWEGYVRDRSVRVGKRAKTIHVGFFVDEQACADAVAKRQDQIDAANAAKLHAMAQELPHTRNLPLRPAHAADAESETAYYGEKRLRAKGGESKEFGPTRLVRKASKSRPGGFEFVPCCIATLDTGAPCTNKASYDGKHCQRHGGGFRVGEATGNHYCTHCKTTQLAPNRRPPIGNGLCVPCATRLKAEAVENGYEGPIKTPRWEELVFDQLLPLITYADGTPFPPDQRDARKGGGLGTSSNARKRRRECDTTTNRFPDCLWMRRDERGRAQMAISVENDEHSHGDRKPECEVGKVEDTFQAVQETVKHEGAATGSAGRVDGYMIPVVVFRFNSNAYDKARVKLEDRVKVLADLINSYAHLDAEAISKLQTHAPILHVLYYHTKEGGKHLAHYAQHAVEAGWALTVH